ncbi:MAG TPA: tetratricopeptide repeat protein [Blastocatellia bacterium]
MKRGDFLRAAQAALLLCIHLTGGVSAQSGDPRDPVWGRIILIKPEGSLKVRQSTRTAFVNATEGMLVRKGYLLSLSPTARAVIICGDGKKRELRPGPQGCPCTRPCTPEVCGIRYDGSTIGATRGPDTDTGAFPVVISPRKTMMRSLRPTIRWTPVVGAKETTTYNVTLYGEGMKIIWSRDVVSQTRLLYPDDEPDLRPGQTYKVVVTSEGSSSQQDHTPGLGFTTLTAEQAQRLADEETKIKRLELPDPQTRFLIANLYAARELYSEAIEQIEALSTTMKEPALASALGDLYAATGLNRESERKYLTALSLTSATDLDNQGLIERNLARAYENLGIIDRALMQLREAIKTYRRLNAGRMVKALLNEERRLKKRQDRL